MMDSVHALFDQRKALLPYYYSTAYRSVQEELPLQAPLCLYYDDQQIHPDDPAFCWGATCWQPACWIRAWRI